MTRIGRVLFCAALFVPTTAYPQSQPSGIAPSAAGKSLSVSSTSSCVAMTQQNTTFVIWNVGSVAAYFNMNGATATTGNPQLPSGGAITVNAAPGATLCAITASSTTTLQITQGLGFPAIAISPAGAPMQQTGGTVGLVAGSANIGNVGGTSNVTPTDCSGTITAGGTAQNAHAASSTLRGAILKNIDTSEVLWFSITGTAAAGALGSYPLAPGAATTFAGAESFATPLGLGYNTALSVVAATTAHKFSCTRW